VEARSDPVPVSLFDLIVARLSLTGLSQQWPQKFFVDDLVWVYRAGDGWVEAKITKVQTAGSNWVYSLEDKNGTRLWSDRPTLFRQDELSYDECDD
jgi:hypothetical protein